MQTQLQSERSQLSTATLLYTRASNGQETPQLPHSKSQYKGLRDSGEEGVTQNETRLCTSSE